jgi:uncharacterized membrane protein
MTFGPLLSAGFLLGVGMGGFVDGIVFHQILQFHNMLSGTLPPDTLVNAKVNMFWDCLFHAFTWVTTAVGLGLLWRAGARRDVPWSGRAFLGSMVLGWGIFNLIEGVMDHHILGIHHVVEALGLSVYDYGFLGSGVLFGIVGWMLIRSGQRCEALRRTRRNIHERGAA